jgi:hypothetical protein
MTMNDLTACVDVACGQKTQPWSIADEKLGLKNDRRRNVGPSGWNRAGIGRETEEGDRRSMRTAVPACGQRYRARDGRGMGC